MHSSNRIICLNFIWTPFWQRPFCFKFAWGTQLVGPGVFPPDPLRSAPTACKTQLVLINLFYRTFVQNICIYTTNYRFFYRTFKILYLVNIIIKTQHIVMHLLCMESIYTINPSIQTTNIIASKLRFWWLLFFALIGPLLQILPLHAWNVRVFLSLVLPSRLPHVPAVITIEHAQNSNRIDFPGH